MKSSDLFGRENQGQNYDQFRPKYPKEFFEMILKHSNNRENYLDVGCGTGQLLFKLSPYFKSAVGTDISDKQISTTLQKIQNNKDYQNVVAIKSDAHTLPTNLKENNLPERYDLVTIGQALHWFDVDKFLEQIYNDVLRQKKESTLAVSGYYWETFDINIQGKIISGRDLFNQYYSKIEPYYDFDRQRLYTNYDQFNFNRYFQLIDKSQLIEKDPLSLDDLIKYTKTSSAYNSLVELNQNKKDFIDPTSVLREQIQNRVEKFQKQNSLNEISSYNILKSTSYFIKIFKRL